jgi:O-antigen/teichoic acid export membrane protein
MIRFSLPLSLNSVCYWLLSDYNRIAIKNVLGLSENGIFSIAGRFTTVLTLVSTCFSLAWQELVYSKGNDKDKSKFYNTASNYYLKFVLVALLILVPAVRLIFPFLINKQYNAAFGLIPLNLLACCASIYSGFLGNIFGAEKKNNVVMYSTVVAAAVNVGVLHLLIGSIGIQAANISLFLGFLANIIMRLILLNKTVKLKFDFKFLFITVIIFIIGYYIYFQCGLLVNFIFAVLLFILSLFVFKDLVKMAVKIIREKINKHI